MTTFPKQALDRAAGIRLLCLDVDGVLTDGRLHYSSSGEEVKAFAVQDGLAIKLLQDSGLPVAVITGRSSPMVERRCTELGIQHLHQGSETKLDALNALCAELGLEPQQVAHMGDDLPDLPLFSRCGLALSVPNGHPEVRARAHFVTQASGGYGAVREAGQLLMTAQGTWAEALDRWR